MYVVCKQKTAYEMRSSDWSSDVCSSDLDWVAFPPRRRPRTERKGRPVPGHVYSLERRDLLAESRSCAARWPRPDCPENVLPATWGGSSRERYARLPCLLRSQSRDPNRSGRSSSPIPNGLPCLA